MPCLFDDQKVSQRSNLAQPKESNFKFNTESVHVVRQQSTASQSNNYR
jgi:hypothetical protein